MLLIFYSKFWAHNSWVKLAVVYCFCSVVCPPGGSMLLNKKIYILTYS